MQYTTVKPSKTKAEPLIGEPENRPLGVLIPTHTHTHRQGALQTDRQTRDRQTDRKRNIPTDRQGSGQTDIQNRQARAYTVDRQRNRQPGRQIYKGIDRQTDKG